MKKRQLEQLLNSLGYKLVRQNKHDIWANDKTFLTVPQHKELNLFLAKKIIRKAEQYV